MLPLYCLKRKRHRFFYQIHIAIMLFLSMSGILIAQEKTAAPVDSSSHVVQDVKEYSKGSNIFSKIVKLILVRDEEFSRLTPLDPTGNTLKRYAGKTIRNINIAVLDVFGGSVDHPQDTVRSWIEKTGNSLHAETKKWKIKNMLIFAEGDKFIPYNIKESERIIRQNLYVYDARIIPQNIKNNPDSVDINVYVQDLWSLNGSAAYHPSAKEGGFSFSDLNFFGYGNEFKGGLTFDPRLAHGWDWNASYAINNIERTFLSSRVFYASSLNQEQYGFSIGRDFFSPIIKWAGGVEQNWTSTRYPEIVYSPGNIATVRYNQQDYWLGYAFDLRKIDSTVENQNQFNVAGRITRTVFGQKPVLDTVDMFQNNTFYLGRIGYAHTTFYEDQYIFGLGVTEDIPLVKMIALLLGHDVGSHTSRPYYGITTSYGMHDDSLGYLFGGFQMGAFRSNGNWLNQTALLELLYYSNLHPFGNWKWRQFIGSRYSYSIDPLRPQGVLNINNEGGLRGFSDSELKGSKKLVVNYEADFFPPLKFVGFKLAIITFADFGMISSDARSLFTSKLFQGYGFGFRIKNEHLIFPAFQFMFGYYPNINRTDGLKYDFFSQSTSYYRFNKFQFSTPTIVTAE
jgi:hypothetical protein